MKKLFGIAIVIHVLAAWFSIGRFHADEQFQIIEFAAYKAGINDAKDLPWEFHEKIRPAIQPAIAYAILKASSSVGINNPFTQAFLMRLSGSLLALFATWMLLSYFKKRLSDPLFKALTFLSLLWCFVPWFHARFSSENISASLFIIGLFYFLKNETSTKKITAVLFTGLLLGLSGVVRFQMNFMVFGFLLWMIFADKTGKSSGIRIAHASVFVAGALLANLTGILFDKWFYGTWELTGWEYLYQNIFLHKAEQFGTEPFWYYFEKTITDALPPFSILILLSFGWFVFRFPKSVFTWTTLSFLIAHLITSHKELRFLFPLLPFIPVFAILSFNDIMHSENPGKLQYALKSKTAKVLLNIFIFANTVMTLYLTFKPADDYTPTLKFLYDHYHGMETLMLTDENLNPYSNATALKFYRSKSITPVTKRTSIDSLIAVHPGKKIIWLSDRGDYRTIKNFPIKKVYSSLPEFLQRFNFNNWIDRVNKVYVYEVNK